MVGIRAPKFPEQRPTETKGGTAREGGAGSCVLSLEDAGPRTLGGRGEWEAVREEEYDDRGVTVGLSHSDREGAHRCPITRMLLGNSCSLYIVALRRPL